MTIHEPATLVTDYLLAAFTTVLASRLFRASRVTGSSSQYWWGIAFAATAVASVFGGSVHGFPEALGGARDVVWLVAVESLVVAAFAVVRATLLASDLSANAQQRGSIAALIAYACVAIWVMQDPRFVRAIVAYASALVVLVVFQLVAWRRGGEAGKWFLGGVALSVVAAYIQQAKIAPHPSFNHNDLYHVVQAVAVWLLYRGAAHLAASQRTTVYERRTTNFSDSARARRTRRVRAADSHVAR
jgi:hypothetical protein